MTLGLTLSEVKSCVTRKARNVIYYRKTPTGWRSGVTERTERAYRGRKGGSAYSHRERRNARRASVRRKREERPSGRNSPTRRIHGEGRRKEAGKNWGAKGIPQSALWGSVNATLKSAYKSLRRRFPSARGVPIGLKLVRLTAFVPSRFFFVAFAVSSLCLASTMHLWLDWKRERFFCNRCVSATANRFNCHEYCPYRYCNDCQDSFADLRWDVRR